MEQFTLHPHSKLYTSQTPSTAYGSIKTTSLAGPRRRINSIKREAIQNWGRRVSGSWTTSLGSAAVMLLCPTLVILAWIALDQFDGSISAALLDLLSGDPIEFATRYVPKPSFGASVGYFFWILFQSGLYNYLPSRLKTGQLTPAGHLLKYYTNGLLAWVVTHVAFAAAVYFDLVDPAIIAKNWAGLLIASNVYGYSLSTFAYVKAHIAPTHPGDRKFSGCQLYDFYMGIELNPRFGKYWDYKLFCNGRPGIIAWTLIDLSFTAWQYQMHGFVSNTIIIADVLHAIYVLDFFINEDWYLRTIDISHDHFGFYLAWGSLVWLPSMYTLQTQYLARYPVALSPSLAACVSGLGIGGYVLFRSVNHQKDVTRRTNGQCMIWGTKAEIIRCNYTTKDGTKHESLLLSSGWWGFSRHANYLGDLILSYSMCATCGLDSMLPWTYGIFMTILLVHRSGRSDKRCAEKYGEKWNEYCRKVRWILVPGIY